MLAIVIRPNGTFHRLNVPVGQVLPKLYSTIGCDTVTVTATDTFDAWMDDEGLFTAPVNPLATMLLTVAHGQFRQEYHGAVVLLNRDDEGETRGLSELQAQRIIGLLRVLSEDFATFAAAIHANV